MAERPASRSASLALGVGVVVVALAPAVDVAADRSLTVHMIQHVALLTAAPPLIVFGAQVRDPHRQRSLATVVLTLLMSSLAMVLWHLPALYDAAGAHTPVHVAEHLTYLATSIAFWWAIGLGGTPHGGAIVAVFVAALPGSAIGAALTLASRPVYRAYTSLTDQQLAGVVMWAFAGLAYVLAAAVTFALWLRAAERAAPSPIRSEVAHG